MRLLGQDWLPWAAVMAVFAIDSVVPLGVAIGVLYVVAVAVGMVSSHTRTIPVGIAATLAVIVGLASSASSVLTASVIANRLLSIAAIWVVVAVALRLTATTDDLNESRARIASMIGEIEEYAIIALDTEGRVAEWNRGAARIKGYEAEEIIGQSFQTFYSQEDLAAGLPHQLLTTARDEGMASAEGWRLKKDGSRFWATVTMTAFHDDTGALLGFSKITRDLTERRLTEAALTARTDQLEAANEQLEQFIYIAAHDLQAPIRTISNYVHLIGDEPGTELDPIQRQYLDKVLESTARMGQLLNDLLSYARIGWDADAEAVDLASLVAEVVDDVLGTDRDTVDLEIGPLPTVAGHATYLRLALQNLVDNAVKYAEPERRLELRITAEQTDGTWVVAVADNGIGFSNAVHDRVFSVFQRLPNTEHIAGSGIGLAHCRKIARMHHGEAWAESVFGEGSTFYLSLADMSGVVANGSGGRPRPAVDAGRQLTRRA